MNLLPYSIPIGLAWGAVWRLYALLCIQGHKAGKGWQYLNRLWTGTLVVLIALPMVGLVLPVAFLSSGIDVPASPGEALEAYLLTVLTGFPPFAVAYLAEFLHRLNSKRFWPEPPAARKQACQLLSAGLYLLIPLLATTVVAASLADLPSWTAVAASMGVCLIALAGGYALHTRLQTEQVGRVIEMEDSPLRTELLSIGSALGIGTVGVGIQFVRLEAEQTAEDQALRVQTWRAQLSPVRPIIPVDVLRILEPGPLAAGFAVYAASVSAARVNERKGQPKIVLLRDMLCFAVIIGGVWYAFDSKAQQRFLVAGLSVLAIVILRILLSPRDEPEISNTLTNAFSAWHALEPETRSPEQFLCDLLRHNMTMAGTTDADPVIADLEKDEDLVAFLGEYPEEERKRILATVRTLLVGEKAAPSEPS